MDIEQELQEKYNFIEGLRDEVSRTGQDNKESLYRRLKDRFGRTLKYGSLSLLATSISIVGASIIFPSFRAETLNIIVPESMVPTHYYATQPKGVEQCWAVRDLNFNGREGKFLPYEGFWVESGDYFKSAPCPEDQAKINRRGISI